LNPTDKKKNGEDNILSSPLFKSLHHPDIAPYITNTLAQFTGIARSHVRQLPRHLAPAIATRDLI
jgi:hypothetical protein